MDIRIETLKSLCKLKEETLLDMLSKILTTEYGKENVIKTKDYIIAKGNNPIGLVAHLDTVFENPPKEREIFYDSKKQVMWSEAGLGADDRLGVFLILEIIKKGYRPTIIFTTKEENGGIGASILVSKYEKPIADMKYLIQLDRRGKDDCVFYNCINEEFIEYVESFGFKEEAGLFSDISVICPQWHIAGVNLSIGYHNEHSYIETAHLKEAYATLEKVVKMIEDADNINSFDYIGFDLYSEYEAINEYISECSSCGKIIWSYESAPVMDSDGVPHACCSECLEKMESSIAWCGGCGRPYVKPNDDNGYCVVCELFGDEWEVYDEE